jgi:hypothetical protein
VSECFQCGGKLLLVALHGDAGGPDVCLDCHASIFKSARDKQRTHDATLQTMLGGTLIPDRLRPGELSLELCKRLIALLHPDRQLAVNHPEAATLVADLTPLLPHLRPKPKPKPVTPTFNDRIYDNVIKTERRLREREAADRHSLCRTMPLRMRCDECQAQHDREQDEERAKRAQAQREYRQRARKRPAVAPAVACAVKRWDGTVRHGVTWPHTAAHVTRDDRLVGCVTISRYEYAIVPSRNTDWHTNSRGERYATVDVQCACGDTVRATYWASTRTAYFDSYSQHCGYCHGHGHQACETCGRCAGDGRLRSNKRGYCSDACRQKAYRARKTAKPMVSTSTELAR